MQAIRYKNLFYWLAACAAGLYMATSMGCANIQAPMGGPKDTTAPVLQKVFPENYSRNFAEKVITLSFDEYVDLDEPLNRLIVNPPMEKQPLIERKLRTVTIKIKDTLAAQTTYSLRLDKIIRDVNEGNPQGDYTYVFSTGSYIDSASVAGVVTLAQTGEVDSTLIVVLHSNLNDTAVVKLKPRYVTRLDGEGFFRFQYVAPGRYNLFALKDEGVKRYNDSTMLFAFLNEPIVVGDTTPPVSLLAFRAAEPAPPAPAAPEKEKEKKKDANEPPKKLTYKANASRASDQDILQPLELQFDRPLGKYLPQQFVFTDTLYKPIPGATFELDSTATIVTVKYPWKLESWYSLQIPRSAVADSAGVGLAKNDTLTFKTRAEKDYGALKVTLIGVDFTQKPVLQFFEQNKLLKSIVLPGPTITDKLFKPGEFQLRILLDANNNGIWDTGDYTKKRQPEKVISIPKKITIKANWDNEFDIDINAREEEEK